MTIRKSKYKYNELPAEARAETGRYVCVLLLVDGPFLEAQEREWHEMEYVQNRPCPSRFAPQMIRGCHSSVTLHNNPE
jgi:hypothetical protein